MLTSNAVTLTGKDATGIIKIKKKRREDVSAATDSEQNFQLNKVYNIMEEVELNQCNHISL
jgi:hypothetical protein